ncbi:MAG: hypothetical protein GY740_20540 [Gammaproteobacteria bacterium]|nr:hypothetical protein [Gammaproteobacteria bacterium]
MQKLQKGLALVLDCYYRYITVPQFSQNDCPCCAKIRATNQTVETLELAHQLLERTLQRARQRQGEQVNLP